jgi:hypothetical protein
MKNAMWIKCDVIPVRRCPEMEVRQRQVKIVGILNSRSYPLVFASHSFRKVPRKEWGIL